MFTKTQKQNQTSDESKKKSNAPSTPEEPLNSANDLKEKGNECVKAGNYAEAVLHYSFAIKINPNDPLLYSNRCLAFLKLNQLYYANEDAEKTIQLRSDWAKVK